MYLSLSYLVHVLSGLIQFREDVISLSKRIVVNCSGLEFKVKNVKFDE